MKRTLIYLTLIVGITAIIGACKKNEDDDSSSTGGCQAVTACSTTASGAITGIDNASLSGTFSMTHKWAASLSGIDNTTGCTTNSTLLSGFSSNLPTGTAAFTIKRVVTSSSTFADLWSTFSDTSCSTEIATLAIGYGDISVNDNVTNLTADTNDDLGTTATKVTFKQNCLKGKGSTSAGTTWLTNFTSGSNITWSAGEELTCSASGDTYYALWHVDNSSKRQNSSGDMENYTKHVWDAENSSSAYPTAWDGDGSNYSAWFEL